MEFRDPPRSHQGFLQPPVRAPVSQVSLLILHHQIVQQQCSWRLDVAFTGAPLATPGMGQVKLAMDTADVVTPLQRTNMDKLFDYLLGEGPNNRYALICTNCATHNGLIREEDLGMSELQLSFSVNRSIDPCYCWWSRLSLSVRPSLPIRISLLCLWLPEREGPEADPHLQLFFRLSSQFCRLHTGQSSDGRRYTEDGGGGDLRIRG